MAVDRPGAHVGEHSSTTTHSEVPPNHLGTAVPSGDLNGAHDPEKTYYNNAEISSEPLDEKKPIAAEPEDEDEDMDALIEDLESQDGQIDVEEEETETGGAKQIPEDQLQTDTRVGLSEAEVLIRRKRFGLNQMKEEKDNHLLKFLGYFVGPIQFVMEVRSSPFPFFTWAIGNKRIVYRTWTNKTLGRLLPF